MSNRSIIEQQQQQHVELPTSSSKTIMEKPNILRRNIQEKVPPRAEPKLNKETVGVTIIRNSKTINLPVTSITSIKSDGTFQNKTFLKLIEYVDRDTDSYNRVTRVTTENTLGTSVKKFKMNESVSLFK